METEHSWIDTDFGRAKVCLRCEIVVNSKIVDSAESLPSCMSVTYLPCPGTTIGMHRLEYLDHLLFCVYCVTPVGDLYIGRESIK